MSEMRFVLLMNSNTWVNMQKQMIERASLYDDPIEYLNKFKNSDIIIDESVPDNFLQAYNLEDFKKGRSES